MSSSSVPSHYEILSVAATATPAEIKAAFRKCAKEVHPDAGPELNGDSTGAQWIQVLKSYEVLSDARSRQLYDLSISSGASRLMRSAAAAGVQQGVHEDEEIDLSWGFGARPQPAASTAADASALDRLRGKLESDVHTALRHAYLGPKLDGLQRGQLPECFEADERSTDETPDVLHLVSGRQLLGVVRERRPEKIANQQPVMAHALEGRGDEEDEGSPPRVPVVPAAAAALRNDPEAEEEKEEPLVLNLILVDAGTVAEAVCHPSGHARRASFYKNGSLVAHLIEGDESGGGGEGPQEGGGLVAKVEDASGRHTHSIIRSMTPLVRHLTFVAELGRPGSASAGRRGRGKVCVARAHRPWLPPSSLWPFKPRSYDHDIGGWIIEWTGHGLEDHPGFLDPGIVALVAAVHTVGAEAAAARPQGVFAAARQGDETAGGIWGWLRAMMRFHRRK